jgi:hypothetical protein
MKVHLEDFKNTWYEISLGKRGQAKIWTKTWKFAGGLVAAGKVSNFS